jgi:TRAP-type C4-dicarboxylate transport system permease small subunit
MTGLQRASRWLGSVENALAQLSALALLGIMLVVVADVAFRYFLSSPLLFAYDLISMYLVVVVFYFALPDTLHRHGHIAIDFFQPRLPARLRFAGEAFGYAAGALVMALIAWKLTERCWTAFEKGEVPATTIAWPIWLSYLPAAIGCWLFTARALYRAIGHLASMLAGRALVELPPPPIGAETETETDGDSEQGARRASPGASR